MACGGFFCVLQWVHDKNMKEASTVAKLPTAKRLLRMLEEYIDECRSCDVKKPPFPNIAGFCRWAGISMSQLLDMKRSHPEVYETVCAYFEDAALNSGVTASLIGMYLKQYGLWATRADDDEVICDHDMLADGI